MFEKIRNILFIPLIVGLLWVGHLLKVQISAPPLHNPPVVQQCGVWNQKVTNYLAWVASQNTTGAHTLDLPVTILGPHTPAQQGRM